jgi:hypothetical protein
MHLLLHQFIFLRRGISTTVEKPTTARMPRQQQQGCHASNSRGATVGTLVTAWKRATTGTPGAVGNSTTIGKTAIGYK